MMQATPNQMGHMRALRQQAMRDQDRERAMFKDAAYRAKLDTALQHQITISDMEQRQRVEEELQRLSDVYEHRVDRIGEAHVEAAVYMQQQSEARAAQEQRLEELNERQGQRFHSALSVVKAQQGIAKAQVAAVQQRRAQILRAERHKAQAFAAAQAGRAYNQKRRQADLARQELERRKRSPNGLSMDFRQTRLHEGHGQSAPQAETAMVMPQLPDPIESAEELQHRAEMEKRRREAAAAEAEIRARERFLAAQAKLRAEAQKRAVEAELAELAAQRLQAKKQALAAHRLHLRDQRKQQELQRVFEDNFLSGAAVMDDDLAPRAIPAFLQPALAGSVSAQSGVPVVAIQADASPLAVGVKAPLPPLPTQPFVSTLAQPVAVPRWSKCRTAPLGRQPPPPPLPVAWVPFEAPLPPPREEVAVQTDPEPMGSAIGQVQQSAASHQEESSTEAGDEVANVTPTEEELTAMRRLAWSNPEFMAAPVSTATASAAPFKSPPSATTKSAGCDTRAPQAMPERQVEVQLPPQPPQQPHSTQATVAATTQLEALQQGLGDGDDEADAWGEEEIDLELARMKKELGIEDSDLRSSISSIDSGVSVPSFLKDVAAIAAARQAGAHTTAAAPDRGRPAVAPHSSQVAAASPAAASIGADRSPQVPRSSPRQGSRTADVNAATPPRGGQGPVPTVVARGGSGVTAAASKAPPASGVADAVAALDAIGAMLRPTAAAGRREVAGSVSPSDTLDSSILRILDSSPSSASAPTSCHAATPPRSQAPGDASGQGGAARASSRTPGESSLPSDLDDVLLLSELDWEELEALAGLRGTDVTGRGPSSQVIAAAASPSGARTARWTAAITPLKNPGASTLETAVGGGFRGVSPSSTFSEVSSSVSNDSLQRLVAQGILPPEIATLLASTPPSSDAPSRGLPTAQATLAAWNWPALTHGGRKLGPPAAATAVTAAVPGVASASPSSSTISGLTAILGQSGATLARPSNASETSLGSLQSTPSLSSLASHVHGSKLHPPHASASTTSDLAARGLFTIPEGGVIALGDLSTAIPPAGQKVLPPDIAASAALFLKPQLGRQASAQLLPPPAPQQQDQIIQWPQGRGPAAAFTMRPGHASGLPEPVRLRLSDLNRQLLSSAGAPSNRGDSVSPGAASPSGPRRPVKPGPLIITSGLESESQPSGPKAPGPSCGQQHTQTRLQLQLLRCGLDAPALSMSLTSSTTSLSLSPVSSLSLSPAKQGHQHGSLQPCLGAGGAVVEASTAAAGPAADTLQSSDILSTLSSLDLRPFPSTQAVDTSTTPLDSSSGMTTPLKGNGPAIVLAGPTARATSSPYELYDKEAARLAELMATINNSLRHSAEAVARAGGGSSLTSSSVSGIAASSSTSAPMAVIRSPSWGPHAVMHQQSQQERHAARPTAYQSAAGAATRPSALESSASPPTTFASSWTLSSMPPLPSPPRRQQPALLLGTQSPAATMLQRARRAAAVATASDDDAAKTNIITTSVSDGSSRGVAAAAPSIAGGSSLPGASSSRPNMVATAAPAPSAKRQRDDVADRRKSKTSARSMSPSSTSISSLPSAESRISHTVAVGAASEAAAVAMAAVAATGGDGRAGAGVGAGGVNPAHLDYNVPSTPMGLLTSAGGFTETTSTSIATPSSILSNLSSVFAMLRVGAPSGAVPISQLRGAAPSHFAQQPGSPPPPPQPEVSPIPSIPSPPPTPYSPVLSESSYNSLSLPATSPSPALAVPLAALGSHAAAQPQNPPSHEVNPSGTSSEQRATLPYSLSSSDGVSSVAEVIAGLLGERIRVAGCSHPHPMPVPISTQQPQEHEHQLPKRSRQQEMAPARESNGASIGVGFSSAMAGDGTSVACGSSSSGRRASQGVEVWASLTGQTLAEALEGLVSPGEPYEDLLRSSLALSSSSLTSGGALAADDDPQLLNGSAAASDPWAVNPYDAPAPQGTLWEESEAVLSPPSPPSPSSMSLESAYGKELEKQSSAEEETKSGNQPVASRSRPTAACQLLANVDAALARITSNETLASSGQQPATQVEGAAVPENEETATTEAPVPLSSFLLRRSAEPPLPTGYDIDAHEGVTTDITATEPPPATAVARDLELRSSGGSDEFGFIMAGMMQDIQRGLAALQMPPLQVPQPEQRQLQQLRERQEVACASSEVLSATPDETGSVAEGHAVAPLLSAVSSVPSILSKDDSDEEEVVEHDGIVPWWPEAVPHARQVQAAQVWQRTAGEIWPDDMHVENTADPKPASTSSSSSRMSNSAARQLHQMPTLSRGVADAPAFHAARGSNPKDGIADDDAQNDPGSTALEASGDVLSAVSRHVSHASAASSAAASSVTLSPVDTLVLCSWPDHTLSAAPRPAAVTAASAMEGGAYSFLQPPRASLARNRTPPSVQSGAESPTRAAGGSGSSSLASVSTVSSLDSLTHALAQYPVFGGATQSPMGSQSPASSEDDPDGIAAGGFRVDGDGDEGADHFQPMAAQTPLPIQYEPSQPPLAAPAPTSFMEQEPWKGAWDTPLPVMSGRVSASAADRAGGELLGLEFEAGAHTRREFLMPEESEDTETLVTVSEDISFGAVSTGRNEAGQYDVDAGDDLQEGTSGPQGAGLFQPTVFPKGFQRDDESQTLWGNLGPPEAQLEAEYGSRFEPESPVEPEPVTPDRGRSHLSDPETAADTSNSSPDILEQDHQQQALSPLQRRHVLGLQPLTLEIPVHAGDQPLSGASALAATAMGACMDRDSGAAHGSDGPYDAAALSTPFSNRRIGMLAGGPPEEQEPASMNREHGEDGTDNVGMGTVAILPGNASGAVGSGGGYVGALSEELLQDLLMWTVSDFFSSPGSGGAAEAD